MSKYYKEKALLATENKIDRIKEDAGFFKRNQNKLIIVGAVIALIAPLYNRGSRSLQKELGMSYENSVLFIAAAYASICFLSYVLWSIQDRLKLKRLMKRKKELEEELKQYD